MEPSDERTVARIAVHELVERRVGDVPGVGMPGDGLGELAPQRATASIERFVLGDLLESAGVLARPFPDVLRLGEVVNHDHPAPQLAPYWELKASCRSLGVTETQPAQSLRS